MSVWPGAFSFSLRKVEFTNEEAIIMAGTRKGGLAAARKNKARDPEFYARIGALGGRKGKSGGFASDKVGDDGLTGRQRAAIAGARGGRISRRTKKTTA